MRKPRYDINIENFLPHRPPMLMECKTPYLDAESVETHFKITEASIFTDKKGLFSEPGLIETAAQACSAITGQDFFEDDDLEGVGNKVVGYISAIKKVEIFLLPKVGDTLITKAKLISRFDTGEISMCTIESSSYRNDDIVINCTFNFLIHEV
ncbi:ABC transporter permease [Maribacter sp. 2308TA10-17]|uniref:ABC transporter permease n=1 Tax=Maribacter sp. 2308TA10-17 TaxID=3386276 RepID=UPI0039BC2E9F